MASRTAQNVSLGLLAAAAAGLSAFAVWHVQQPHESLATAPAAPRAVVPTPAPAAGGDESSPADEQATATTEPPAPDAADDADATEQPYPGTGGTLVQTWQEAWSDDQSDLLVIGDGHSNLDSQWVQAWAEATAQDRPVDLAHWGEAADVQFNDPLTLSEGDGPLLRVWSASRAGSTITEAGERVGLFIETSQTPQAVLVSLGQSSGEEDVTPALDALLDELVQVPVLVTVGPRELYPPGVADAVHDWAEQNAERVAVVDLRDMDPAEPGAQEWARAFQSQLDGASSDR